MPSNILHLKIPIYFSNVFITAVYNYLLTYLTTLTLFSLIPGMFQGMGRETMVQKSSFLDVCSRFLLNPHFYEFNRENQRKNSPETIWISVFDDDNF